MPLFGISFFILAGLAKTKSLVSCRLSEPANLTLDELPHEYLYHMVVYQDTRIRCKLTCHSETLH